jgi:hypothetical protein
LTAGRAPGGEQITIDVGGKSPAAFGGSLKRPGCISRKTWRPRIEPSDLTDRSNILAPMNPGTDTRGRILTAARELFHGHSDADVGIKEIC